MIGTCTIKESVEAAGGPGSVALVFRIQLTLDAMAAEIGEFSECRGESKVIVAAESLFRVDGIGEVSIGDVSVPEVSLSYAGTWSDREIDLDFHSELARASQPNDPSQEGADVA
jgi:hypothetical protein